MKRGCRAGVMSSLRDSRGWTIPVLLVALLPLLGGGCYGSFPLTNKIYDFNGDISRHKLVQTVTFWVLVIVPVYEFGMLADAIVFNLIEFWTGEEVLALGPTMDANGYAVCLTPSADGRQAVLTVSRDGEVVTQEVFLKVSDTEFEVRDAQGTLHGKVLKAPDGTISLTGQDGVVIRTLAPEALAAL